LGKILNKVIEHYSAIFLIATILSFLWMFFYFQKPPLEAFLQSFLTWSVGVRGIIAFVANWIPPFCDMIAEAYGWPRGSSVQREIASAEGAFGILGILCNWVTGGFWIATLLGVAICWFLSELKGLATIKIRQKNPEYSMNSNLHLGMFLDFLTSIAIFACLIFNHFSDNLYIS